MGLEPWFSPVGILTDLQNFGLLRNWSGFQGIEFQNLCFVPIIVFVCRRWFWPELHELQVEPTDLKVHHRQSLLTLHLCSPVVLLLHKPWSKLPNIQGK